MLFLQLFWRFKLFQSKGDKEVNKEKNELAEEVKIWSEKQKRCSQDSSVGNGDSRH